jgi:uncharacterized protein YutE (UPF0331/DUF86 family)/predicted nucleotidyltransferase
MKQSYKWIKACYPRGETMSTARNLVELLKNTLRSDPRILLAYLIGSHTRGVTGPLSDVDIALLTYGENGILTDVGSSIAKALGIPQDKVDIIDISKADLHFKYKVLSQGIKLVDRGQYEASIKKEVNQKYPEVQWLQATNVREWLNLPDPSSVDPIVIKKRLDTVKSEASFLKEEVLCKPANEVASSQILKRLLERSVHIIAEAILDVCRHTVSSKGWGPAETYKDYIELVAEHSMTPRGFAEKFKKFIEWRNVLFHRYLEINYQKLYRDAQDLTTLASQFERHVIEFLRQKP